MKPYMRFNRGGGQFALQRREFISAEKLKKAPKGAETCFFTS
jgi:hypothetical protein